MIFNRDNNGAEELRAITSSYYANNDFTKISNILDDEQRRVAQIIGRDTMDKIQTLYDASSDENNIVHYAQEAIALMATMKLYQRNDISHEDNGRKVKIDSENERRPFEWQLARDEKVHIDAYYNALDSLMENLNNVDTFKTTYIYKIRQDLIVNSLDRLEQCSGAVNELGWWMYYRIMPFIRQAQMKIEREYGETFSTLKAKDDFTDDEYFAACTAETLAAMEIMISRTGIKMLPYGFMQVIVNAGGDSQEQPTLDEITNYRQSLVLECGYWIKEMKRLRDINNTTYTNLNTPNNENQNKYFRL